MTQQALDHEYVVEFMDQDTYLPIHDIHTILTTLYNRYGKVRRQDVKVKERELENYQFVLTQPLTEVWKEIDELQKLATAANMEYSNSQLVQLALAIIQNTHDFERGIYTWLDNPREEQTYANFKKHFNLELTKLQEIRGDDMLQSVHHHANVMRGELESITNSIRDELNDDVLSLKNDIIEVIKEDKETHPPNQLSNQ